MDGTESTATDINQPESVLAKMSLSADMDMPTMQMSAMKILSKQVNFKKHPLITYLHDLYSVWGGGLFGLGRGKVMTKI